MAKLDPNVLAHLEWLGFVRPTGLVVSAPALVRAGAILDRRDIEGQRLLRECVQERTFDPKEGPAVWLPDFRAFAKSVLGWSFSPKGYAGVSESPIPTEIEMHLPEYGETLRPDLAVRELEPKEGSPPWQLLVRELEAGTGFDWNVSGEGKLEASAHGRMERLLRQTGVPAGLLFNGRTLRLLSAPRGESSGWLDFHVADMVQTAGRPISTALRLLLSEQRLLALPRHQRLAALLEDSRKFQNEVSERLAEQVLHALYELLRGFQAAHDLSKSELLREVLADDPDEVYRGLLTVLLRLVFLLYAEERDMLPEDETFVRHYSLAGLHEHLRGDAALYPDTMEQRFGAWAQLLTLFRIIHDGAETGSMRLPRRHGVLFDPDRFRFLEGRARVGARQIHERIEPPHVPDGTIHRVLEKLLVLDGERISYRALDVEQIGSVYETMMGFRLETTAGPTVAIKAPKKYGAPTAINLQDLLGEPASGREKWLRERTDRKAGAAARKALGEAASVADLHAALHTMIDHAATPDLVPRGAMVPQPSDERRRSGTDYTPRTLTEPIVRTALEPILARIRGEDGRPPRPEQILELKFCDPAMGSGAFLVEMCRQLSEALVEAWHAHGVVPTIPIDEDERTFAGRQIAQRCLYGVDRNPLAADLAKVSLWLATLARDHAFTFVDHALRHGDSLVGLGRRQIEALDWDESKPMLKGLGVREALEEVSRLRRQIREAGERVSDRQLRDMWRDADSELSKVRLFGDLIVLAFFKGGNPRERERQRAEIASNIASGKAESHRSEVDELRGAEPGIVPFHWEIEFPEVFERANPGFDAFVGNPPFQGGRNLTAAQGEAYSKWLAQLHDGSSGGADLVAHFYRRTFRLSRQGGVLGLIATNTIAQGDTRATGLRWICNHGGTIIAVRKRVKWPGRAAVVVSVVHIVRGHSPVSSSLDGQVVERITAFLFHRGGHDDPIRLAANASKSFQGSIVLGMGFTFDDADARGLATPLAEMERLIAKDPKNQDVILPYIGGEEVNTSPTHAHRRYVIDFGEMPLCRKDLDTTWKDADEKEQAAWLQAGIVPADYPEAVAADWPDLLNIIERKVKPERITKDAKKYPRMVLEWWKFWNARPALSAAIEGLERVLVICRHQPQWCVARLAATSVFAESLIVFPFATHAAFCALQSRVHETWARFFGSSIKDDLRYTPSDCFETFPFPEGWDTNPVLEATGRAYHDFRATLMVRNEEGLTKIYNRFHDPDECAPEIQELRLLHAAMDRAVFDAYGWSGISTDCEFLLDYEIDEEEWGNKRKPWRFRWPDAVRDEVLARLLELNAEQAKQEVRMGTAATKVGKASKRRKLDTGKTKEMFS